MLNLMRVSVTWHFVLWIGTGCRIKDNGVFSERTTHCVCLVCKWIYLQCDSSPVRHIRWNRYIWGIKYFAFEYFFSISWFCWLLTYLFTFENQGRFEILSLSGSFLLVENNGHRSRTGGLSVTLSAPDGHVLGGCVAGLLIAASPVQVLSLFLFLIFITHYVDAHKNNVMIHLDKISKSQIVVGSFIPEGQKEQRQMELPHVAPSQVLMNPSSPQSRGTMSESSIGGHGSPLHQSTAGGPYNNTNNLSMPWN